MSSYHNCRNLTTLQSAAIRKRLDAACMLPEPPEEWRRQTAGVPQDALRDFVEAGVIKRVRKEYVENHTRWVWRTAEHVVPEAKKIRARQDRTPCGNATGIRTIKPGEYTCTDDDCDCRMDRETAERVVA